MDCNDYKNLITDYLENRCTPDQCRHMELHFSECEKCRAMAEQEKSVMAQLSEILIEPCPDEIIDHVMELISGRRKQFKERILSWFKPGCSMRYGAASLAGALIIALLVLFLHIPGPGRQTMDNMKYSPEEIQKATAEARLAFAYFAVYSRKTETALKKIDLVEPVIRPIEEGFNKALGTIPYI